MPHAAAISSRSLMAVRAAFDHPRASSANPQLIDKATGLSSMTRLRRSIQPF